MEKGISKIRVVRLEHNMSQGELAERLGVSRQTIFAIERGLTDPSVSLACKIAELFHRQVEELFFDAQINTLLADAFRQTPAIQSPHELPAINMYQDEKHITIECAVPGFSVDEIDTEIGEDYLIIRGNKLDLSETHAWLHQEFDQTEFERSINLPVRVNPDKARAVLKHGKLSIALTIIEPKTTKLTIKTG